VATDLVFAQMEKVAPKLPDWFGRFDTIVNMINSKADVEKVSERDFRATYLTTNGGRVGTYNPDGGGLGLGSAQEGGVMITTYFPFSFRGQITQLASRATAAAEQSRLQGFKKLLKTMIPDFADFIDRAWHMGDGTAVLGTAISQSTVGGKTVYVMDTTNGVQGFRRGEWYNVYDAALAAPLAGGPFKLASINYATRALTFAVTIAGAGATNKIVFEGTSGATPAGLKGLLYHNNTATSGTTHGVNRANEPEILVNVRDGGASVPTVQMGMQIAHQIIERRKIDQGTPSGMMCLVNQKQQANIRQNVWDISNYDLSNGKVNADLMPKVDMRFMFAGIPAWVDPHQATNRIDYITPQDWSIAEIDPVGWFEMNGNKLFPLYALDGSPAATAWFALYVLRDYLCQNFGNAGVIYNLAQPTY